MSEGEIVCKYCGTFLTSVEDPAAADKSKPSSSGSQARSFWFILILVVIVIGIIVYFSR
ncbi:hypothetical protein ACFQ88_08760 [Paenibacillus sp. NPDC056579]|uniref:hypothetical protein n=1 Tax=Paenibacillus sp. NPDC056579 TaxID=3345871 RepID=UPI00368F64B0